MKSLKHAFSYTLIIIGLIACGQKTQQKTNGDSKSNSKDSLPFNLHIVEEIAPPKKSSADSIYSLISGTYMFQEDIKKNLPTNSADYFKSINFPYYFPKSLSINFYCEKLPFAKLEDFFIFNKVNNYTACEYISLIDTMGYTKVIARKCEPMEGWISLFIFGKDYKVKSMALLLIVGGEWPDESITWDDKDISYKDYKDSLKYSNGIYKVIHYDIYQLVDKNGNRSQEVGRKTVKTLIVDQSGKIKSRDSVVLKKIYVDLLDNLHSN